MREPMNKTCTDEERALDMPPPAPAPRERKYLLSSGIAKCGLCGEDLEGKPNRLTTPGYACVKASERHPNRKGCGRIYIKAETVDDFVTGKVLALLAMPGSVTLMQSLLQRSMDTGRALTDEIAEIQETLRQVGVDRVEKRISVESYQAANAAGIARMRDLRAQARRAAVHLEAMGRRTTPQSLVTWWEKKASMQEKHDLIRIVVEEIRIQPTERRGFQGFQEERVEIVWQPGIIWAT